MKHIIFTIIILLTLLFSAWCSSLAAAEPPWWRSYCIRHWLQEISVEMSMPVPSDPNGPAPDMTDPNNWVMETIPVRINLVSFYAVDRHLLQQFQARLHPGNRGVLLQPLISFREKPNE